MAVLIKLAALAIAVFVASYIIPGVTIDSIPSLLVVAIVLGVVNTFIKPILIILTLPLTVLTLGIFLLLLNGILIMLVSYIVPGFNVETFLAAILFSIVVSLVSTLISKIS